MACCDNISLWMRGAYQATNDKIWRLYWKNWSDVLGNGVGEGKERPAHAVGECVEQDPEQEQLKLLCPVQNVNITEFQAC